jgi:hypothetical protein
MDQVDAVGMQQGPAAALSFHKPVIKQNIVTISAE